MKRAKLKFLLTIGTGMVLGIMLGCVLLNAFMSYRMDECYEKIQYLRAIIEDKNERLDKLETSINSNRFILKDIKIVLDHEVDAIDEIDLEKELRKKYTHLLGKEVKSLDIDMISGVIDNRIIKMGRQEYKLKVKKVLLTDLLKIYVDTILIE